MPQRLPFHPAEGAVFLDDDVSGGGGGGGDLDDLCTKHIDLDADDFADGCRFLHQIALGNLVEVTRVVGARGSKIVNFRDYDRRSE